MTVEGLHATEQAPRAAYGDAAAPNPLAIAALVTSLFLPLAGIVLGHLALAQIRRTGEQGRGLALAGTVIGYSLTGLVVLIVLASVLFVVVMLTLLSTMGSGSPVLTT